MIAKYEIFMNTVTNSYAIAKMKYACQRRNTKGIIDVIEEIWFTNIHFLDTF